MQLGNFKISKRIAINSNKCHVYSVFIMGIAVDIIIFICYMMTFDDCRSVKVLKEK